MKTKLRHARSSQLLAKISAHVMCGCGVSVLVLIFAANDMIDHDVPKVYQPPTIHDLECSTICLYILQLLPLECNFLLSKE